MMFICKQCAKEFEWTKSRKRVFCSLKCKSDFEREFDPVKLAALAEEGLENRQIASALNISPARVNRILHRYGLHDLWRRRRYEILERTDRTRPDLSARKDRRPKVHTDRNILCVNSLLAGWKLGTTEAKSTTGAFAANAASTPSPRSALPMTNGSTNCGT